MKLKNILLFFTFMLVCTALFAQEDNDKSKDDPKSLMSTYYNDNFSPFQKGNYFVTFTVSLNSDDYNNASYQFQNVIQGESGDYSLKLTGGYYFSDNFAGSLGFQYGNTNFDGTVLKLRDTINKKSLTKSYTINPSLRSSIPLVKNQRLSLYVDMGFGIGWGNTVSRNYNDVETLEKTYADNFSFGVGISPGVTYFVMENFAMEVGLNILGYNYSKSTSTENDGPDSIVKSQSIDFNLDLLSLKLALAYYIGTKKVKLK